MNAALYDFAPVYPEGEKPLGRPPLKGKKQVSLQQRYDDPNTQWQKLIFSEWYGEKNKPMLICSGTSVWYRGGKPLVNLKWVLLKDPEGKLDPSNIPQKDELKGSIGKCCI